MEGWITIHRKIQTWGWYKKSDMVHLFIHLLLNANRIPGEWQGIKIGRGQLITGRKQLSLDTGITERSIRTCLNRLKTTSELTIKTTNKYSLITILKYDDYQQNKTKTTSKTTSKTPTSDQQVTTNNNITRKQYNTWCESSDETYKAFVDWLYISNPTGEPLNNVLSLGGQISPTSFKNLMAKYPKDKIKTTIENMESKDLSKYNIKSFVLALNNWLKRD